MAHAAPRAVGDDRRVRDPLDDTLEGRLLAHERHHVLQYMVWGPLFIPVYFLLVIPFGYRRRPMERAAIRAATDVRD